MYTASRARHAFEAAARLAAAEADGPPAAAAPEGSPQPPESLKTPESGPVGPQIPVSELLKSRAADPLLTHRAH